MAGSRRLWWGGAGLAAFLAACAFFDVVVDVPVVQIVDVGLQLLDKVIDMPVIAHVVFFVLKLWKFRSAVL